MLKEMTSSAAFRCVQAWLLEKPAAWADDDAPCLAAALMAQRPPCDMLRKRPRDNALLEAERSHQRARIAGLDEKLLDETLRGIELERENSARTEISAGGWAALTILSTEIASEPGCALKSGAQQQNSPPAGGAPRQDPRASAQMSSRTREQKKKIPSSRFALMISNPCSKR